MNMTEFETISKYNKRSDKLIMITNNIEIIGLEKLGEETKAMFYNFLETFMIRQSAEGLETFKPISVKVTRDKENGEYIRFDYEMFGRRCWLHVKSPGVWY